MRKKRKDDAGRMRVEWVSYLYPYTEKGVEESSFRLLFAFLAVSCSVALFAY